VRDPVVIDPIVVPKAFDDQGYTPQAFANQIRDQINEIRLSAMTKARKEGLAVEDSRENFGMVNKESFAVLDNESLPDIEIPETTLSFRTAIDFLEGLLHLRPRHISGEVTVVTAPPGSGLSGSQSGEQILITIRVTRMGKHDPRLPFVSATSAVDPKEAITNSAKAVLQIIDPYTLAAYEYEIDKDEHKAWYLTTQCYGNLAKWGWLLQGILLEDQHDLDGAIDKYKKAVKEDPQWAYPYNDRGNVLYRKQDYEGAIAEYQRAAHLDHRYADAYSGWADALLMKKDYEGAISQFQHAMNFDPKNGEVYNNWGISLLMKHDYEGAIAKFQQALKLDPDNQMFSSNLEVARKAEKPIN